MIGEGYAPKGAPHQLRPVAEALDRVPGVDVVKVIARVQPVIFGIVDHEFLFEVGSQPRRKWSDDLCTHAVGWHPLGLDGAEVDAQDVGIGIQVGD